MKTNIVFMKHMKYSALKAFYCHLITAYLQYGDSHRAKKNVSSSMLKLPPKSC